MKEATGELSMTVVTIVAIVAIAGIIYVLREPMAKWINETWTNTSSEVVDNNKDKVNLG